MKEINFLVIPGWIGKTNIDDITFIEIKESYIMIHCESKTYGWSSIQCLLKGKSMPEFISKKVPDYEYQQPYHSLSESDFEKYKAVLQKLIKVNIIDPLKEE